MKIHYLLFLFCLISCTTQVENDPNLQIVSFTHEDLEVVKLKGEKIELEGILYPRRIMVKEDKLILSDRSLDRQMYIYDLYNYSLISKKGINGFGPGEISVIWKLVDIGEIGKIWAYDTERNSYFRFDLNDENPLADLEHRDIQGFFMAADMTWASDSTFWVTMVDGDTQYFELNLKGDTLNSWGNWKSYEMKKDIPASVTSSMHQGALQANIKNRQGVRAGRLCPYVDVYNFDTQKGVSFRGPVEDYPEYGVEYSMGYPMPAMNHKTQKRYYFDSFAGDNYAFALYNGALIENTNDQPGQIIVFNYEGSVVKSFQLDFPISNFIVDEKENKIYGITRDENPGVAVFDYKGLL